MVHTPWSEGGASASKKLVLTPLGVIGFHASFTEGGGMTLPVALVNPFPPKEDAKSAPWTLYPGLSLMDVLKSANESTDLPK
jgi:hypothetical protein